MRPTSRAVTGRGARWRADLCAACVTRCVGWLAALGRAVLDRGGLLGGARRGGKGLTRDQKKGGWL
jgi:hypothetical protein